MVASLCVKEDKNSSNLIQLNEVITSEPLAHGLGHGTCKISEAVAVITIIISSLPLYITFYQSWHAGSFCYLV